MNRRPQFSLIPFACVYALLCLLVLLFSNLYLCIAMIVAGGGALLFAWIYLSSYAQAIQDENDDIFNRNTFSLRGLIDAISIPCVIFDENGRIIWRNDSFARYCEESDIFSVNPSFDTKHPQKSMRIEVSGRAFHTSTIIVPRDIDDKRRRIFFQYWIDNTESEHYSRLYEEKMPLVALLYIDNYEDLASSTQFMRNNVLNQIEEKISEFAQSVGGVYRRFDESRFFMVFEAKYLSELEKQKFAMLDSLRVIETDTANPITLSVSIGVSPSIVESDRDSRQAMELALSRGGDQIVIKQGGSYSFYGAKRLVGNKQSRVKSRMFAKALRQLMENSSDVFIIGHKNEDMDCIGSAVGIMRCAQSIGKKSYYILNNNNASIETAINMLSDVKEYKSAIKNVDFALNNLTNNSLLVVVDTQSENLIPLELYKMASKTVIIDHHRKSVNSLSNPTLIYSEASSSSASEMVTEVIQYFGDNIKPTPLEAGVILAGITVDTKNFVFNTGSRTFEAAGYLRKNGADTITVKNLYQDDKETFMQRARVVNAAEIFDHGVALSVCPSDIENKKLISAQAADALVALKGIEASFVLSEENDTIYVSGRSLGRINVQLVLEKIGGGGHLTIAGAQLKNVSITEAIGMIKQSLETYFAENKDEN